MRELEGYEEEQSPNEEVINIQFTSGTTSSPKAACLTHRNILNNGYFIGAGLALQPGDVVLSTATIPVRHASSHCLARF